MDGAWAVGEHAGGVSRRPRGTLALARTAKYYPVADQPCRPARLHCRACRGRLAAAFDGPAAVVVSPLFPLPDARGRRARGSDRANRHAAHWPLAAQITDRGGSRIAPDGTNGGRS